MNSSRKRPAIAAALALPLVGGTLALAQSAGGAQANPAIEEVSAASPALAVPTVQERYQTLVHSDNSGPEASQSETADTVDESVTIDELGWQEEDLNEYAAYWGAGYTDDQLEQLMAEWNVEQFEAKARAGTAILAGDTSEIEAIVGEPAGDENTAGATDDLGGGREEDLDKYEAFWDAGFTFEQLTVLAEEWNVDSFEAKARAGAAILAGDTTEVDTILSDSSS